MDTGRHTCTVCNETYTQRRSLLRHYRGATHRERTGQVSEVFNCSSCGKTFTREDVRDRHQKEVHQKVPRRAQQSLVPMPPPADRCSTRAATTSTGAGFLPVVSLFCRLFWTQRIGGTLSPAYYCKASGYYELLQGCYADVINLACNPTQRHFDHGKLLQLIDEHVYLVGKVVKTLQTIEGFPLSAYVEDILNTESPPVNDRHYSGADRTATSVAQRHYVSLFDPVRDSRMSILALATISDSFLRSVFPRAIASSIVLDRTRIHQASQRLSLAELWEDLGLEDAICVKCLDIRSQDDEAVLTLLVSLNRGISANSVSGHDQCFVELRLIRDLPECQIPVLSGMDGVFY